MSGTESRPDAAPDLVSLYRREHRRLVTLAYLLSADMGTAEDLVQDAFIALQRRWNLLSDQEAAAGYVRMCVVNGARSLHRRRLVSRRHDRSVAMQESAPADAQLLLADEHRAVAEAVQKLPRRQQQVVVLRYWSDMSEAQIAEALGVSAGTVKSSASRALATMMTRLRIDDDE